ncbi:MAG: mevalonate kinase [Myxococcota bacterium]
MASSPVASGSGCGKLILCGEHAVVYGYPALAIGVTRATTVQLRRIPGLTTVHSAHGVDDRLVSAVHCVVGRTGWQVELTSDIPMGRGMGSSAALSVALVRAFATAKHVTLTTEQIHEQALAVETLFHGTPSGIDNAVAALGGLVHFRRTDAGPVWTSLPCPPLTVVVLDSGNAGNTRDLVAGVRQRHPGNTSILDAIGALTPRIQTALNDLDSLGPLLHQNHRLLAELGVSTPTLNALVRFAMTSGATGAKLAGAGGGGVVVAVTHTPDELVAKATQAGIDAFCTPIATGVA